MLDYQMTSVLVSHTEETERKAMRQRQRGGDEPQPVNTWGHQNLEAARKDPSQEPARGLRLAYTFVSDSGLKNWVRFKFLLL